MKRSALLLAVCSVLAGCGGAGSPSSAPPPSAAQADAARAEALERAAAAREADRLAALWTYAAVPVGKSQQVSAAITSTNDVDTDGHGGRSVLLVFRDHPAWGRSSYLVLKGGDFACVPSCSVRVTVDDRPTSSMAARRPKTDEAIAMFINDSKALWRATQGATHISIEFPVKAGGTRTATFDVAGLDRARMPGWDRP